MTTTVFVFVWLPNWGWAPPVVGRCPFHNELWKGRRGVGPNFAM